MSYKCSVVIITKNEEKNIANCLQSVSWADEVVMVDSGSTDRTCEICLDFGCKLIKTKWLGFGKTKKIAVDKATHNWIFSIDADEVVSPELKNKILEILKAPKAVGYNIKRNSFYLGKKIHHCGWGKDYTLRLFNKEFGNFNEAILHESVMLKGKIEKIKEVLYHYTFTDISSHMLRMDKYAQLAAQKKFEERKSSTIAGAIIRGFVKFIKMYFLQLGFLDGKVGLILSYNSAFGIYLKYLKLWELNRHEQNI